MKNNKTNRFAAVIAPPLFGVAFLLVMGISIAASVWSTDNKALAATSSTINFQARLLTAAGSVVPDGYYNVEFKLYKTATPDGGETAVQGSCLTNPGSVADEDCLWTETRTDGDKVRVANGYLTVNLGSVDAFSGGMPWDQELWLTMNIGGTGSPSWDGEMNPRLKLTATPYAYRAGALVSVDGAQTATISESGTICIQSSVSCGFAATTGAAGYIQNQYAVTQSANMNIRSSAIGQSTIIAQGANGQTASLLTLQTWNGSSATNVFNVANNGATTIDTSSATALTVGTGGSALFTVDTASSKVAIGGTSLSGTRLSVVASSTSVGLGINQTGSGNIIDLYSNGTTSTERVLSVNSTGSLFSRTNTNSADGFTVQNAASTSLLNVDTTNGFVINNGVSAAGNLLENAGFESTGTSTASGWNLTAPAVITVNSSGSAHTGNYSVIVTPNAGTINLPTVKYYQTVPGDQFYAEVWYKTAVSTNGSASLSLAWSDKDKANTTFTSTSLSNASTSWTKAIITGTVPADKYFARFYLSVASSSTTGTWYFDDGYMQRVSRPAAEVIQTDSSSALKVQNAAGSSTYFNVDTSAGRVSIGQASAGYALDVNGDINITTGNTLKVNGVTLCDSTGCTAKTGSGYYIHNDTVQSTANINILSASAGSTALLVQGAASGTVPVAILKGGTTPGTNADLLQAQNSSGTRLATIDKSGNFGVGSAAPARMVDVYTTATDNTLATMRLQQASTGDSVMEYASGKSYYVGVDTSDSNKFKISSSTASGAALTTNGYFGDTGSAAPDSGNNNAQSATRVTTGSVGGTLSSVTAYMPTTGGGSYKMALYSESVVGGSGHPGVPLSSSQVTQTVAVGWNTFTLSPVTLAASTNYWIVFRVSSASTTYGHSVGTGRACFTTLNYANPWVPDYDNSVSYSCSNEYYSVYVSYSPSTGYDLFSASLLSIGDTGQAVFKNSTDSTTAFQIQNSSSTPLFTVDSTNSYVYVGNPTADSTGALLVLDTKNTAGDPTGLNGALYYNSVSNTFKCHEGRRGWQDCLGVPKPNTRRWTYILPNGDTVGVGSTAQGDQLSGTGTLTEIAATSTEPVVLNFASGGVSGNSATALGNPIYNVSANPMLQAYIAIPTTSSVRVFVGLSDVAMTASASPTGNYAAFRYDTGASDANYKCVTNDNGAVATVVDSGIAPGTSGRRLEIAIISATRVEFKIDGAVVCGSVTTDLPAAGTNLKQNHSVTTLTGTSRALKLGWSYVESDK